MPDKSIDPVVEGAHFVDDLQTVISRQKDPQQFGVATVGSFNAGTVANIIPDHADLQLSLRSFTPEVRQLLRSGVATTANAAAAMAHATAPDVKIMFSASPVINDDVLSASTVGVLEAAFGKSNVTLEPAYKPGQTGSEDYSEFVAAGMAKSVFMMIGGDDPGMIAEYKASGKPLPVNHSPYFAPVPEPTIRTGAEALTLSVLMVLGTGAAAN
jgi:hippurate hydrolase